jgi:cytochrome b561
MKGCIVMNGATTAYTPLQKALHWTIAALIVVTIPIGVSIANLLKPGPITNVLYEVHKSIGLTIFSLAVFRVAVRLRRGAPPLVTGLPAWQRAAAYGSHYALYLLIVLVPLAGWAATSACCAPVNLFWTVPVTLPISGGMDAAKPIFQVHNALALTMTALVLVHAGAALHHHFIRRDPTLARMLPGAGTRQEGQEVRVADPARRS